MATPMAPAPRVTSGESGEPAERRGGAVGAGRAGGEWEPGNLES